MRLLIIEDDEDLCNALKISFDKEGYALDSCHNGDDGLELAGQPFYSVIILDRMLPGKDGLSLLKCLRKSGVKTPVILLTALGGINDRVDGLEAGADDYLVKPFDTRELLARIKALLRRPAATVEQRTISFGDVTLDPEEYLLTGPSKSIKLSPKECLLAECLFKNSGKLTSRNQLYGTVWGSEDIVEDANLDTYICFLRRRLQNLKSTVKIATVRGCGYRAEYLEK